MIKLASLNVDQIYSMNTDTNAMVQPLGHISELQRLRGPELVWTILENLSRPFSSRSTALDQKTKKQNNRQKKKKSTWWANFHRNYASRKYIMIDCTFYVVSIHGGGGGAGREYTV